MVSRYAWSLHLLTAALTPSFLICLCESLTLALTHSLLLPLESRCRSRMATLFTKNLDKSECIYLAQLAQKLGKFDQMAYFMHKWVLSSVLPVELDVEERNLLFVAQNNVIESLRTARQTFLAAQQEEREKDCVSSYLYLIGKYISDAEYHLSKECYNMLELLKSHLIPPARATDDKVYYYMTEGDYYRYLAEVKDEEERNWHAAKAETAYVNAQELATDLIATHETKLNLALNHSTFLYDFLKKPYEASEIAKKAFEEAADELVKTLGKGPYDDSGTTVVMKLIRDKLKVWESEAPGRLHKRPWRSEFFP
ncbi:14-3-3 protein 10-like [Neltuma alba]|uniref:14-3-3 protein 10-like n=1 Tax=Neltuma alba TaxID=207710 RepID=UPI0010A360B7|nr:14-3-3 protein 10-like [Prosopis alba]